MIIPTCRGALLCWPREEAGPLSAGPLSGLCGTSAGSRGAYGGTMSRGSMGASRGSLGGGASSKSLGYTVPPSPSRPPSGAAARGGTATEDIVPGAKGVRHQASSHATSVPLGALHKPHELPVTRQEVSLAGGVGVPA